MARTFIFKATGKSYAGSVEKSSAERFGIGINLVPFLRDGATLSSGSCVVTDLDPAVTNPVTSTLLQSASCVITSPVAEVIVRAGTTGHRYRAAFTLRDSRNFSYEEGILVVVR